MKVTLIYCGVGVAGFNPNRVKGDREGSWIGHGVASVGASAKAAGFEVDLIDLRKLSGWEELREIIREKPSDVYGLSVSAVDNLPALQTVYEVKTTVPAAKIIVGGIHPTILPTEYDFAVIDTVVTGEGEITFPKLLKMVENAEPLPRLIKGEKPDLNQIPWVDRELFDYQKELDCYFAPEQKTPSITMLAGRGCPYHCAYCQPAENAVFGKPFRIRSVNNVMAELHHLYQKYQFKSVTFWDDTFTFNKKWVHEFCDKYDLPCTIVVCSRADIICDNEEMIKRMAEIGVDWMVVGMESGSQRLLDFIKKGTTVEQNLKAREICGKYGIKVFATFMYGLPTETPEESNETTHMINVMRPEVASPFWFVPIPGTGLYDYCNKNDLIIPEAKEMNIARTGRMERRIKNVNYDHLALIMERAGGLKTY